MKKSARFLQGSVLSFFILLIGSTWTRELASQGVPLKRIIYTLPKLGYTYTALEPYIDARTLNIHYTKHHQKAIDSLNALSKDYQVIAQIPLEQLLADPRKIPAAIRKKVIDYGGSHYNHSFFWLSMTPLSSQKPGPLVHDLIVKQFGSFDAFKAEFTKKAEAVVGSGWIWLVLKKDGSLALMTTANYDTPLTFGYGPLLCLDLWEHAYYLKYQYKRRDFIDAWWNVVNWDHAESCYAKLHSSQRPPKV